MSLWVYEARDAAGKVVSGSHDAADRRTALEFLRAQGLFLTRLEAARGVAKPTTSATPAPRATLQKQKSGRETPQSPSNPKVILSPDAPVPASAPVPRVVGSASNPRSQNPRTTAAPIVPQPLLRCSTKDLSLFFRQIGAMIHAGTTIGAALHSMAEHAPNGALRSAARQMEARVLCGETLSDSMTAFPGLFSPLQIGMVNAGERGGLLDAMFSRLARYAERDYDLQQMIKRETWYPKLLVFASIFVPGAVPLVLSVVKGGQNPILAWLGSVGPPLLILGLAYLIFHAVQFTSPLAAHKSGPKLWIDTIKLRLPVFGKVARAFATAKFCRALGALYGAGVGPGESVRLASHACGNAAIARDALAIIPRLEHGEPLTACLASTKQFPSTVLQVMHVGEESGSLDEQLDKSADFLESDAETAVKQSVQVLGIVVFLIIAIRIGMQVGQFWSGYFDSIFNDAEKAVNG
jgi:type II secretory pathway component PulF